MPPLASEYRLLSLRIPVGERAAHRALSSPQRRRREQNRRRAARTQRPRTIHGAAEVCRAAAISLAPPNANVFSCGGGVDREDEKLARILQNEEFLRFLQSDAGFMRELEEGWRETCRPPPPTISRFSLADRCNDHQRASSSYTPFNDDPLDYERRLVPDGPTVDPTDRPLSRLARNIRSKLPSSLRDRRYARTEDMLPHTVVLDYAPDSGGNELQRFAKRLRNMSKSSAGARANEASGGTTIDRAFADSQARCASLARRFISARRTSLASTPYFEHHDDLSYHDHAHDRGGSSCSLMRTTMGKQ